LVIADVAGAEEAAKEMNQKGFNAIGVKVDVSSEQDTERMADETIKAFKRIDILVNNAGIYSSLIPGPFEKITVEEWRRMMDVNVIGMFLCCRAVIGEMRKNKEGRIINIASIIPFRGTPFLLHYTTSKGAVVALTRALAKEVGADVVGSSALLTTTMEGQKRVVEEVKEAGLRDRVKVVVGGAPTNQEWAEKIGADAYAENAAEGVAKVKQLTGLA